MSVPLGKFANTAGVVTQKKGGNAVGEKDSSKNKRKFFSNYLNF